MLKRINKGKNRQERNKPETKATLIFSLILPHQKVLSGKLLDINANGAAISFPRETCPDFEKDERIRLRLSTSHSDKNWSLDALVVDWRRSQDSVLCQFKFIDTTKILQDLDPLLISYFNRREAFRVRPDPLEPITVNLKWKDILSKGEIMDISLTGVALRVESSIARQLEYADGIEMTFYLPTRSEPFHIIGKTAHFEPMPRDVRYAIKFDRKKTPHIRAQEQSISRYVMQRQLIMLKRRADQSE